MNKVIHKRSIISTLLCSRAFPAAHLYENRKMSKKRRIICISDAKIGSIPASASKYRQRATLSERSEERLREREVRYLLSLCYRGGGEGGGCDLVILRRQQSAVIFSINLLFFYVHKLLHRITPEALTI
jgi:hypothetical protein